MFKPALSAFSIAFLMMATGLTGCVFETETSPAREETLWERLENREVLALEAPSLVDIAAHNRNGEQIPSLHPGVLSGRTALRSTGEGVLLVEALQIELEDVHIEEGIVYGAPIDLTDLKLRLGMQVAIEATWSPDGTYAHGSGLADLLLDWALQTEQGEVHPLATQRIRDADFSVEVRLDSGGSIHAAASSIFVGRIWDFSAIELSDFSMAIRASSDLEAN